MSEAKRDGNFVPTLLGVSNADGVTPVPIYANPTTHRLLVDLAAGMTNPMTTGGDLIYGGAAGTPTRLANGTAGQVLTSQGTTLAPIWSSAGAGDMVLASVQTNSGAKTFLNNTLLLRNPANTFSYTLTAGAIAADRVLNVPVITGTDTLATLGLAQTFTATQTFTTPVFTGLPTGTGVASAATVSTLVSRDANANVFVNNYFANTASTVSAGGTTVLTVASARTQNLTGSSAQTFQLPDATTLALSSLFEFNNNSSQSLTITNAGAASQYVVPAGGAVLCFCTSIGTANGTWDFHAMAPATVTWGSGTTGLVMNSALSTSPAIAAGTPSATVPAFLPQRASTTNGYSGDTTSLYGILSGVAAFTSTATNFTVPTLTATTSILPSANDGAPLGSTAKQFSDLFLASGGVVDWAASTYTLTQSSQTLTATTTADDTTGTLFELYKNSATPAANDVVGDLGFYGKDSAANKQQYARIQGVISDPTSTTESGFLRFGVVVSGTITSKLLLDNNNLYPATNDTLALGTSAISFSDLFLASGAVVNFNAGNYTITHSAGLLTTNGNLSLTTSGVLTTGTIELGAASDTTLARSAAGQMTIEGVQVDTVSNTVTLTNKRITLRTGTTTSSGTPTINTDNVDFYSLTAQAVDITSFTTNLSGTPTEGQKLQIAITGTAARAITWGTSFEASTVALPTTTVTTNRLDVGFVWNTVTNKWRCIAAA